MSLDHPTSGVDAFARFDVGDATFIELAPLTRDGAYELAHVPEGPAVIGARTKENSVLAPTSGPIAWTAVAPLDVIVAGGGNAVVYVLRGHFAPKTRDELLALVVKAPDVATEIADVVGHGDDTAAGRELYEPNDHHAVLDTTQRGEVTVCAVVADHVRCISHDMLSIESEQQRYDDGTIRHHFEPDAVRLVP
jgi:hypothetical protein